MTGLEPDTEYGLAVEHAEPDRWLPDVVRTLVRPSGRLVATIATANDVHFGETECGRTGDPATDAIGPILHSRPGDPPYPLVMGRAAVAEIAALEPDAVVVKGDLTDSGRAEEYEEFLSVYGAFGPRLHHVRGNHDAMRDPSLATEHTPYAVALEGVTLAVLDSTVPGLVGGALAAWADRLARRPRSRRDHAGPGVRAPPALGSRRTTSGGPELRDRPGRQCGCPGPHRAPREHRRLLRRAHPHQPRATAGARRDVPLVEVACAKDYPGAWAEYRVYEGGYTQVMRRLADPAGTRVVGALPRHDPGHLP